MLQKIYPKKVKLLCGFIYQNPAKYQTVKTILIRKFGKIDFESQTIEFSFTDYYREEFGSNLLRRFISFDKLVAIDSLTSIKTFCVNLEKKFSQKTDGEIKRTINIDPGYINESKLVLTTTKDFSHRLYIGKGIYAEVTLLYNKKEKNFLDLPTTFPDYRTPVYKQVLLAIRDLYAKQIKHA